MLEKLERKLFTMILKQLTYWFDFQNREIEYLHKITSQSISRTTIFYSSPVFAYPTIDW